MSRATQEETSNELKLRYLPAYDKLPKIEAEPEPREPVHTAPIEYRTLSGVYRPSIPPLVGITIAQTMIQGYTIKAQPQTVIEHYFASSVVPIQNAKPAATLQRRLLEAENGYIREAEAARRLTCSIVDIEQKRANGEIIGISTTDGFVYPSWQFKNGNLLDGLAHIFKLLSDHDAWMKLSFMLSKSERLDGLSPLQALRSGKISEVERIASTYGEQGAV
jgi:hypothetical protein